jgi:hypothetical protein
MVEIRNPNIEIRNKYENQIFKCSKRGLIEFGWACWRVIVCLLANT